MNLEPSRQFDFTQTPSEIEIVFRRNLTTATTMSQPSLANYIVKRPWLKRMMMPLSNWYCNAAGYRKLGLRYGPPPARPPLAN